MENFREFENEEIRVFWKKIGRGDKPLPLDVSAKVTDHKVAYFTDTDELWTKCIILWGTKDGVITRYISVGAAKRANYNGKHPMHDEPSDKGREIAFYRALKAGFDDELVPV